MIKCNGIKFNEQIFSKIFNEYKNNLLNKVFDNYKFYLKIIKNKDKQILELKRKLQRT